MTSNTPKPDLSEPVKKPYQPPHLEVYGDLSAVTQAATSTGAMNDGGAMPNNKT